MRDTCWAIRNGDQFYTHGYPSGDWNSFPRMQVYHSKSAATRQANKLKKNHGDGVRVVLVSLEVDDAV